MTDAPWELPQDWRWARFHEVARVASDLVDPNEYADLPHIAPNHIESATGRLLPYRTVSADGVTSLKHRFRAGQLLYSKIRPYLAKVVVAEFAGVCSADMYPIETKLDPRFLKWWMLTGEFTRRAAAEQARTVLPKINVRGLSALPVPVPRPDEQRRIVEILEDHLSRLDAGTRLCESIFHRREYLIAASVNNYLDSVGGDAVALNEVSQSVRNGIFVSRPGTEPNGVPILRISAVRPLRLDTGDVRFSGRSAQDLALEAALLSPGDLLFTRYNGNANIVGACAVVPDAVSLLTYPDKLIRIVPLRERVDPFFLSLACNYGEGRRQIRSMVKTTAGQAGIAGRDLKRVVVRIPDLATQLTVASCVRSVLDDSARVQAVIRNAVDHVFALRRSLLAAAFAGRLTAATQFIAEELADV